MGQKVHPGGLRVGVIHDWKSNWMVGKKEFAGALIEDIRAGRFVAARLTAPAVERTGSRRSSTHPSTRIPMPRAVDVMNCHMPTAAAFEYACGLNPLSTRAR